MAITIDDLPGAGSVQTGYGSLRLLTELVGTLRAHQVHDATGFVIGERLVTDPEARTALAVWIGAGYDLGNHSFAHPSLNEAGVSAYLADLARAEPLMAALRKESGQSSRYFRYPFLEEGRTEHERDQVAESLHARGYAIARVSLDFFDWAFADPYVRCLAHGDAAGLSLLSASYLTQAAAYLTWAVTSADRVLKRPLPQVLLLHANVVTAQNLDALLTQYERAGVVFIPLAEALADPAYGAHYDGDTSHVLMLSSQRAGRSLVPAPGRPDDLLTLVCR